jgi:hypothetical protein
MRIHSNPGPRGVDAVAMARAAVTATASTAGWTRGRGSSTADARSQTCPVVTSSVTTPAKPTPSVQPPAYGSSTVTATHATQ